MGYGEIYNTTWWGVALDTARTAGTEPDFFGSQMKLLTSNQPELVTNGDFATDSDWNKGTGITISGGSANFTGNANSFLTQSGVVSSNKTYKATFTVSNYISGAIDINLGGSTRQGNVNANGTYTFYISVSSGNILYFPEDFSTGFVGSIDNVSIKEVRLELDQIEAKKCLADWIHLTALQDLNN